MVVGVTLAVVAVVVGVAVVIGELVVVVVFKVVVVGVVTAVVVVGVVTGVLVFGTTTVYSAILNPSILPGTYRSSQFGHQPLATRHYHLEICTWRTSFDRHKG